MRFTLLIFIAAFFFTACHQPGKFRAPAKEKGLYGYIDESGDFIVAPKFSEAWSYINGSALVCEKNQWSLIDKNGKYILTNAFDSVVPFSETCFIGSKNGLYGFYAHGTGKELLAPAYEQVFGFTEKLCVVQQGFNLGIVNQKGELVCPLVLQDLKQPLGPLSIVVQLDTTDQIAMLMASLEDGAGGKRGLINKEGKIVLQPNYDEIFDDSQHLWYYPFVKTEDTDAEGESVPMLIGKYGICDTTGKLITAPTYDEMPVWGDGLFRVRIGDKYGFADALGKIVIEPQFDYVNPFSEGKAIATNNKKAFIIDKKGTVLIDELVGINGTYSFKNGRARFQDFERRYGFLNEKGEKIIAAQFEVADDFENGRAIVQVQNKYGVIDELGKFIIEPKYDFIFDLEDGFYQIKNEDGTTGVLDQKGQQILQPIFQEVFHIQKKFFNVEKDGLNGCYDLTGKQIYPTTASNGVYFTNGRAVVEENRKFGLINDAGKTLLPVTYDSIGFFFKGFATIKQNRSFGLI
ncbi:MAG: WG repeat-containing protein, partial [Bacteroidia bacterium]